MVSSKLIVIPVQSCNVLVADLRRCYYTHHVLRNAHDRLIQENKLGFLGGSWNLAGCSRGARTINLRPTV